jgi:hypothetical protein
MQPYDEMTSTFLTEAMGNVVRNSEKAASKYQKLNSLMFEWEIEQRFIKYVYFAADVADDGANQSEITMYFTERYYEVEDTFMIDSTKQMCFVVDGPIRKDEKCWEYTVRLLTGNADALLNKAACYRGAKTRWIGNIKQEWHDTGFVKYQSNVEKQRGYINEIRVDIDASARYEAVEEMFIELSRGSDANGWETKVFAWPDKKKVLLDNFMEARNNSLLWQHGTMDENGKSIVFDRQGRPVIAGDGIIPQINRYASKYNYSKLTTSLLNEIILTLAKKCDKITGNTFVFVVNETLWFDLQNTMSEFLANHHTDAAYIWSKTNGMVKAGATYNAYTFSDNTVIFKVDRALSIEYQKGYGILVDLTADKASGRPAIEMFTLGNKQLVENTLTGVGIQNGPVASPVSGIKYVMSGWQGVAVYNPYRSVILFQN